MELVEVDAPRTVARVAQLFVRHHDTALRRSLEHGEPVVIATPDGTLHAARVALIDLEQHDLGYTFDVGARLPEELARERIEGLDPDRHDLALHEIVDLLGEL